MEFFSLQQCIAPALNLMLCLQAQGMRDCNKLHSRITDFSLLKTVKIRDCLEAFIIVLGHLSSLAIDHYTSIWHCTGKWSSSVIAHMVCLPTPLK